MKKNKIILTSYGLTTSIGRKLIAKELENENLKEKRIFLFHEPHYSIEIMLRNACIALGFLPENIILSGQQKSDVEILTVDYLYCTEGNTFEVMSLLRERGFDDIFVKAFENGTTYIGASAGAIIAGVSIEEAIYFDRNFMRMSDFRGLGLFDGIVIPHCTKEELKKYMETNSGIEKKYNNIYTVENEKSLVLQGK